jgi:hypothetical protein
MIKLTGMGHINMRTERHMWASGLKISSMELVSRSGRMVQSMRVNIKTERNMEMVALLLPIAALILGNSDTTKYLGSENTFGLMAKCMRGNGKITKCMDVEHLFGGMVRDMRVNSFSTKERVMVHSNGKMGVYTKDSGKMENNTELEYSHPKTTKLKKENGTTVRR